MAHPYNNKSPFNCWKGYERVPGKAPGTKGSCRKSSPVKAHGGTHLGEGHDIKKRLQFDKSNRERYDKMPQRVKDSLQQVAYEYGGPFFSPKHQVNVDPEDGVLYNRPIYSDGTMLTYPSLDKPVKRETEINKPPAPINMKNPFTKNRKHNIERAPDRPMSDIQKTYDDNIAYAKTKLSGDKLKSYIEEENAMLKDWRVRKAKDAAASPMKATKGGGTTKVCLPKSKVNSMSASEKKKVVSAKESAGRSGKRERSQRSEVKGARKKGATLKDWFEKENWVNVKTGQECGAPTKRTSYESNEKNNKSKFLKTVYDIGSTFLKGGPGLAATMLTPSTAYAQGRPMPDFIEGGVDNRSLEELERDGPIPLPKFKEETPLNKSNEPRKTTKGKGRNFRTVKEGAGMTEKGVKEYKKKNPGSKLQTAVTEKNPKGKRAARRKSFCARSRGWTGERGKAARRRWNC